MNEFEQRIKDALGEEPLDQAGIIEMAAGAFRGRQRLSTGVSVAVGIVVLGAMVWSGVSFFRASDTRGMILSATLFLFFTGVLAMLKLWFWLLMIRYSLARELKRIEMRCGDDPGRRPRG
jgi:hypothetical protein